MDFLTAEWGGFALLLLGQCAGLLVWGARTSSKVEEIVRRLDQHERKILDMDKYGSRGIGAMRETVVELKQTMTDTRTELQGVKSELIRDYSQRLDRLQKQIDQTWNELQTRNEELVDALHETAMQVAVLTGRRKDS